VLVEFADLAPGVACVDGDRVTVDYRTDYFTAVWLLAGLVPQAAVDVAYLPPMRVVDRPEPLGQVG
jgi:hypothetical protein